jgi:hypothetical protein
MAEIGEPLMSFLRTHVGFRSDAFPAYPDEEGDVWGKRLAEFLEAQLRARGIAARAILQEDWGWVIPLVNEKFPMWIGCGHHAEFPDGFLVFIEPSKPTIRKFLFRKIDTTEDVSRIAAALDEILNADPRIRDVRWWDEGER